jgi:GntR family transcriptional regulator
LGGDLVILNTDGMKPIYVQIAEWLENEILNSNIAANEKMYSQYQLAELFNINPATAGKGITILAEENILYKKRGLGMFVSEQAKDIILKKRKNHTLKRLIQELVVEAHRLSVNETTLIEMIKTVIQQKGDEAK